MYASCTASSASASSRRMARAVGPQQLELQVVERIEIGEAVADRTCERRVRIEECRRARDREERAHGRVELAADAAEDGIGERGIGEEPFVARGNGEVGLRE